MSSVTIVKSTAATLVVYLTSSSTGAPLTSLTYSSVAAQLKKEGGSFATYTLTGSNFTNVGSGFYSIGLTSTETDTEGSLVLLVTGAGVTTATTTATVYESGSLPTNPTTPPTTGTVFGFLYDSRGNAVEDAVVAFRIVDSPLISRTPTSVLVTNELITTTTDSNGFFTSDLIVGSTVEAQIPSANYRFTFVVESGSVNLFDIT